MRKPVLVIFREADRLLPYSQAISAADIDAEYVEPAENLSIDAFSGLVLTGGTDLDPALYGQAAAPETDPPDPGRDACELRLLEQTLRLDLPVLAICRGLQLLNVFHGGSLHQHVASHRRSTHDRAEPAHPVAIEPDSLLAQVAGTPALEVNSRHHQAIDQLGTGLRITARAPDGVIEAIEQPDKLFVLGVQWHPEDQVFRFPQQLRLFTQFGDIVNRCTRGESR